MIERVLVQKLPDGDFPSPNSYIAWRGFYERGFQIGFFTFAELKDGTVDLAPKHLIVGGAGAMVFALAKLGVNLPVIDDLPESLAFLRGRRIWTSTMGQIRSVSDNMLAPVFVKPLRELKAFSGRLVGSFRDILSTAHLPDEMEVLVSEVVNFVAEWRFFVQTGEVIGAGCYRGDPRQFIDRTCLDAAIATWGSAAPSAYGIDLGVTDDGRTLLVEVNDGFSIGCMGLKPMAYSLFLQTRWLELVSSVPSTAERPAT
jgi:hypothetical protein